MCQLVETIRHKKKSTFWTVYLLTLTLAKTFDYYILSSLNVSKSDAFKLTLISLVYPCALPPTPSVTTTSRTLILWGTLMNSYCFPLYFY